MAIAALAVLAFAGAAGATSGSLPGGRTSPSTSSVRGRRHRERAERARERDNNVGQGVPVPTPLSTSSTSPAAPTRPVGACEDQNGDGSANFILDCEIAAAKATNPVRDRDTDGARRGRRRLRRHRCDRRRQTGGGRPVPDRPRHGRELGGWPDVEEVLSSAFSDVGGGNGGLAVFPPVKNAGQFTNFEAAVVAATALAVSSSAGTKIVAFLSDGVASAGATLRTTSLPQRWPACASRRSRSGNSSCSNTGTANQGVSTRSRPGPVARAPRSPT